MFPNDPDPVIPAADVGSQEASAHVRIPGSSGGRHVGVRGVELGNGLPEDVVEVVNNVVHSKSLHDNLAKWKNITIDISNMLRFRKKGGKGCLTSEIVKLGQSIRRIRTLLWTLTASLPSQSGPQEL